jgi:orotate phosphoribosyltransferase
MAEYIIDRGLHEKFDVLVGPSYKGSALAVAAAAALWNRHQVDRGFDYDRNEAKTHGEASGGAARFVTGALCDNCRVMIIDDVVTTMGTKFDILSLLTEDATARGRSYHPAGVLLYMDRQQTTAVHDKMNQLVPGERGQDAVKNFQAVTGLSVGTILGIRETIDYLREAKIPVLQNDKAEPLHDATVRKFKEYLEVYGVIPE